MLKQLPIPIQTAYMELVRRHEVRPEPEHMGSVMKVKRGGIDCWVVRRRAGDKVEETYLCKDTEDAAPFIEKLKKDLDEFKRWRRDTSAVSSMLKSAGCLAPDVTSGRVFTALAEAGFFKAGGLLGGTHAFRLYPLMLGYEAPQDTAYTDDVDLLAPRGLTLLSPEEGNIISSLEGRGLKVDARFGGVGDEVHSWVVEGSTEIEVLTSAGADKRRVSKHKGLGVSAQALKYLEFSFVQPSKAIALHREGVEVLVPSPERFALHKLIVSQVREGTFREKRRKDLRQAAWLIEALLENDPYALVEAWENVIGRGRKWAALAKAGLAELPGIEERLLEEVEGFS